MPCPASNLIIRPCVSTLLLAWQTQTLSTKLGCLVMQGRKIKCLRNIDSSDSFGVPISLLGYPNLQRLFLNCESRSEQRCAHLQHQTCPAFDSRLVCQLHKLQALSLRGYQALDLRFLPSSLQVYMHIGPCQFGKLTWHRPTIGLDIFQDDARHVCECMKLVKVSLDMPSVAISCSM